MKFILFNFWVFLVLNKIVFINYVVVIYKIMVEFVLFILGRYVFFYVFKVKVEIFFMKKIIIF